MRCPNCGAAFAQAAASTGLCPRCLLELGLRVESGAPQPIDVARLAVGSALGPYQILAPLGVGAMGEVYRARDPRLARDVAIKILPESLAQNPDALARFEAEAKAIAALSHPNIRAVHDFGSDGEIVYAVLELLEGETLRARLAAGRLPLRLAVEYGIQIASGLDAAHRKGIVHRDVKPENLFVTDDGQAKILDFGLTKLVDAAGPPAAVESRRGPGQTRAGTILGTIGYMSPEQVRAAAADHRSDIFSFGATFYEMLSGGPAFSGAAAAETLAAILEAAPAELTVAGTSISPALDRIVRHCLEKDPARRFQSAHDLVVALREAASERPPAGERRRVELPISGGITRTATARLAVLPFEDLGSPGQEHFADGIADEVRGKLTLLPGLQVIARGSSMPFKRSAKTAPAIASELEVRYLLTGTVRWDHRSAAPRVSVNPELIEIARSGAPVLRWTQRFDAAGSDLLQMQSEIAARVARALGVALGADAAKQLGEQPTLHLGAYDAFHRGEEASNSLGASDPPSLRRAIDFYEQAVALDPAFARAWAQLGRALALDFYLSAPAPAVAARAREATARALKLAPDCADSYLAAGDYRRWVAKDVGGALEQYIQAWRRAPGSAEVLSAVAMAEQGLGRWDAAVEYLGQARRLDPRSVPTLRRLAFGFLCLRRYPAARDILNRGLAIAADNLALRSYLAVTFLAEGDLAAAKAAIHAAPDSVPRAALAAYVANYADLVWALDQEQQELLLRLTPAAFDDDRGVWGLCLAQACFLGGDEAATRYHAVEAERALAEQLRDAPGDARRHLQMGLALAYQQSKAAAIAAGEHGVALLPATRDAYTGPYLQHQLVRICLLVGEPERALDLLQALLEIPYYVSPAWLRIDPSFDPLRANSRFLRLAELGS